jgi:hypothetical protein
MRASPAFAALVLGAVAAAGAHGSARIACPAPAQARRDPGHGFELHVDGAGGTVSDTSGRSGYDIPGVNIEHFFGAPGESQQLNIEPDHKNSFVVTMVATDYWPLTVKLSRRFYRHGDGTFVPSDVALWFFPSDLLGSRIKIAFATGQSVGSVRVCVNGNPVAPTSTASGAVSMDDAPPILSSTAVAAGAGHVRVTIHARDSGSGLAGVWWGVNSKRIRRALPYNTPVTVARGAPVVVWALDRAGNERSIDVRTR